MNKNELNRQSANSIIQGTDGEGLLSFVSNGGDLNIKEKGLVRKSDGQVVPLTELANKVMNIPLTPQEFETTVAMMSLETDRPLLEDITGVEVQEFSLAGMNDMMFTDESILLTNHVYSFDLPTVSIYNREISNETIREMNNFERNLLKIASFSKVKQEDIQIVGDFKGITKESEFTVESLYQHILVDSNLVNIKTEEVILDLETFHYNLARAILKNRFAHESLISLDVFRSGNNIIKVTGLRVLVEEIVDEFEKVGTVERKDVEVRPIGVQTGRVDTLKENKGTEPKEG